eukprot:10787154-Prorocentrum_lima.AAC.1
MSAWLSSTASPERGWPWQEERRQLLASSGAILSPWSFSSILISQVGACGSKDSSVRASDSAQSGSP